MLKFKLMIACAAVALVSAGYAGEKSMWTKFVEFFSPTSEVEGEGPLYDQVRELDRKINRVEGKYARERRPMTKERYKKELVQLREEREALMKKIEAEEKNKGKSSAVAKSSSSVKAASSSSQAVSSAAQSSSSADAAVAATCKPDTVYVRDTVVVHDTLYVMLAPKPEPAPQADSSAAKEKK
ncbi:hypothetical protein [Fibrobacter sp. UWB5]|uniref:hypothetical protein n=1 Tax=Fibrobacter sp. UWB5 TaxID=1964360 RepID=UPI000B51F8B8|nr:hypothetical protein [Fibrobacter sp. UWB5]